MASLPGVTPLYRVQKPPYTVEVPGEPVDGETRPRRHPKARDGLLQHPAPGVATAFDLLRTSSERFADEPAVGSRKLVRTHREHKRVTKIVDGQPAQVDKEWTYFELSDYAYLTYREYFGLARQLGAGLRKLGLGPGDKLHLFAATSSHWLAMAHACSSQSIPIVTAYDTLGEAGVEHSLVQTKAAAMYVDPHLLKTAAKPLDTAATVRFLVYNDATHQPIPDEQLQSFKQSHPNLAVLSFSELRALGEGDSGDATLDPVPPTPDDTFCIMYTSGSTGPPKGVPVTHAGFVAAVAGLRAPVEESVSHGEFVLAYLPLAHIFELVLENLVLCVGATLGYGSPRTLADASMRRCPGDMRAFRPTVMVGVPAVWEMVRKGVVETVAGLGAPTRALFWGALALKSFLVAHGLPGQQLLDGPVFGRVRGSTGGRLRFIVNGASGIAAGTKHFMSMVVAPMLDGYGLTETGGNGALGSPLQYTPDAVGPIGGAVEVKLASLPDLGYSTATSPPQGEIFVRGAAVFDAYYDNPDETAAAKTPDGWFRTGDVGEFTPDGHLRVVDRVKNLVKMQGGEYIALERLEAVYRGARFVSNVLVYADSEHSRPIAVVCPNKVLAAKAAELGVSESAMHADGRVRDAVLKDLVSVAKQAGLSGMEWVAGVLLVDDEWTPANGLVTATQKTNRRAVVQKYKREIEETMGGLS